MNTRYPTGTKLNTALTRHTRTCRAMAMQETVWSGAGRWVIYVVVGRGASTVRPPSPGTFTAPPTPLATWSS